MLLICATFAVFAVLVAFVVSGVCTVIVVCVVFGVLGVCVAFDVLVLFGVVVAVAVLLRLQ